MTKTSGESSGKNKIQETQGNQYSMLSDLINTMINNKTEEIRTYRTIIASSVIAAITIPLGIITIEKPEIFGISKLGFLPKPGLIVLGLWVLGFISIFMGIKCFFLSGRSSKEDEFNLRLERALDKLEENNLKEAIKELKYALTDSKKFIKKGRNAFNFAIVAIIIFLSSLILVYLIMIFFDIRS